MMSEGGPELGVLGHRVDLGETPQVVNITTATGANDTTMNRQWERNTSDNVNRTVTNHPITTAGVHTLRFWMVW